MALEARVPDQAVGGLVPSEAPPWSTEGCLHLHVSARLRLVRMSSSVSKFPFLQGYQSYWIKAMLMSALELD